MADIIKKVKVMQPGGTFTDYIPLGADAADVRTEDGMSVENKLKKKPYYFDTVADMKAASYLVAGDMAVTLGYYSANDGGGAEYKIVSTASQTEYQEAIGNLYATLIIEDYITPEMFGCYGDNTHNDTTNLQALFNYAYTKKIKVILNKKYKITQNININRGINISGSTLNAGVYGNNNTIFIKGGSQTSAYANNSDLMLIESVYFYQTSVVLGDTTSDFGCGITFNKCVFFGNNQNTSAIIAKNNTWIFTINDCKIGNYANGIYFKFKNDDNSYVVNSGAAIKIIGTDIFNCTNALYVKGSAADGYNIQIISCNFEHDDYSIYTEDGRANNIQCNNLHIEGNRVGSIYSDKVNVFISNLWDFDSNPNTYIAKFTAINGGRIILNSGRFSWSTKKLIKNIDSKIYMNLEELIMPPFIYNGQIATDDSNGYIITNDYYNYVIPANVKTKEYENEGAANLIFLQPNSTNGIEMECVFRQYAPTPSSNTPDITIFFESTSVNANTGHITLPYYSTWIYLKINYVPGTLVVSGYYKVDGGDEVPFCRFVNLTSEDVSENRKIYIRYRYTGTATLQTKRIISKFINNKNLVE